MYDMKLTSTTLLALLTLLMSLTSGFAFAAKDGTMTPELAAKREMVRKQHEQKITSAKRKVAVDALKEERLKVYRAKQAVQMNAPSTLDTN